MSEIENLKPHMSVEELVEFAQEKDNKARAFRRNTSKYKGILWDYSMPREIAFRVRKLARRKKDVQGNNSS